MGESLSKTRRKAEMHELQSLGEALVQLSAPAAARRSACPSASPMRSSRRATIGKHEARRRQLQYIGRLMRDVDPDPIRARLAHWGEAPAAEKTRLAGVERWRERLLADAGRARRALCRRSSNRSRTDLGAVDAHPKFERAHAAPPHAYRELFRALNALLRRDACIVMPCAVAPAPEAVDDRRRRAVDRSGVDQ